jgi:hypothetical protein
MVSDRGLLAWFSSYAQETVSLQQYLWNTLDQFSLPSLDICASVVASTSNNTVLAAMKLMSEQGVGSVAVLDEDTGLLLSAVSVTDIGKVGYVIRRSFYTLIPLSDCRSVSEQSYSDHAFTSIHRQGQSMQSVPLTSLGILTPT